MKNDFTVTVQEKIQNSSSALQSADVRYKPPVAQLLRLSHRGEQEGTLSAIIDY